MIGRSRFTLLLAIAVAACGFLSRALKAAEAEKILSFNSHIVVHEDSSMTVRETIKVRSSGDKIKRGIYRDFPTRYKDLSGKPYVVGFSVKEVLRDGKTEAYHIKNLSNGKRVYIGKSNVFLPPGEYTYTLVYETNRQLGFFEDHDELYWNVTGNDWAFPIDIASATIELPEEIPIDSMKLEGYTGPQGSKGKAYEASIDDFEYPTIFTTEPLKPREGLTIVVTWPKGFVAEPPPEPKPTPGIKRGLDIKSSYIPPYSLGPFIGVMGLAIILGYYIAVWIRVGKDPAGGTIIPLYKPPKGFSPASMRYIVKMGYDHKVFAAALINMAIKGYLIIREEKGVYTIERKQEDKTSLAPEEKKIAAKLLSVRRKIKLKQKNHAKFRGTIEILKKSLKTRFEKNYFITNINYFLPGVLISVVIIILTCLFSGRPGNAPVVLFMSVWLSGWSVGVVFLLTSVISSWKGVILARKTGLTNLGAAISITLFATPFLAGEVFGIYILAHNASPLVIFILAAIVFINCLFYHLLKAPTRAGRMLLDKIEGFKMYLSVAEKERLNLLSPPEKTPELFERYLPYALALGVENAWSEQFSDVLSRAGEAGETYSPVWYSGTSWSSSDFASSFGGAFSSAIASSSTAPGSSSGSGGGGSSGGGGGGGGGGGW